MYIHKEIIFVHFLCSLVLTGSAGISMIWLRSSIPCVSSL